LAFRPATHVPNLVGNIQHGMVYIGGTGKIAEHGGTDPHGRDVSLIVAAPARRSAPLN
jgi:hypothetical protein